MGAENPELIMGGKESISTSRMTAIRSIRILFRLSHCTVLTRTNERFDALVRNPRTQRNPRRYLTQFQDIAASIQAVTEEEGGKSDLAALLGPLNSHGGTDFIQILCRAVVWSH